MRWQYFREGLTQWWGVVFLCGLVGAINRKKLKQLCLFFLKLNSNFAT